MLPLRFCLEPVSDPPLPLENAETYRTGFHGNVVLKLALLVLPMLCLTVSDVQAQQQPNRRRQFVQGLLKSFIDSQLPQDPVSPNRPGQARPNRQPTSPSVSPNASPEMRQAGQLLAGASDEMSQLVGALQGDLYRAQGVRQLLSLAMNVSADAAVLSRRLARANDAESLREPLRKLDQDWHTLEYRLNQTTNLSRNTLGHIERIRQMEAQLTSMFNVSTQVDVVSVSQEAVQMNSSLRTLLEDIRYEVTDTNQANQLLQQGRDTWEQLQRFTQQARSRAVTYDELNREFAALQKEWTRYEKRLRRVNNRFVQRQSQSINDSMRHLQALLYVDTGQVDRDDVRHTTSLLQRDTDQSLKRVNLKMLAELPTARRFAIESASDFSTSCDDLLEVIDAGDDLDVIRDIYFIMHDEWSRLSSSLQGISSQQARQSMRDIDRSLAELQSQLGIQFDLDRRQAIELADVLHANSRHVQEDIRDIFGRPNRYPRDFQTQTLQAAAQFQAAARDLRQSLSDGDKLRQLTTACENMANAWAQVDQSIPRFSVSEQSHLQNIRRELTPQVIQMQTLLAL